MSGIKKGTRRSSVSTRSLLRGCDSTALGVRGHGYVNMLRGCEVGVPSSNSRAYKAVWVFEAL